MNLSKLKAHARRFAGMPMLPTPEGVLYPTFDGDMSLLEELADRAIAALGDAPYFISYDHTTDDIYQSMVWYFNPPRWPADRAGQMLADWKAALEGVTA